MLAEALGGAAALSTAAIWAYVSVAYKKYVRELGPLRTNVMRMLYASIATAPLAALLLRPGPGAAYALASGVLSLGVGDTLYLSSIGAAGVSVAAPVSYTYVVLAELISAPLLREPLSPGLLAAAALVVAGVALISRGPGGGAPLRGVLYALGAAAAWSLGQVLIGAADVAGLSPVAIAFLRASASGAALSAVAEARGGGLGDAVRSTWRTPLPLLAAADLGLGVSLFAASISLLDFDRAVVLVSSLPLFAQLMAWASGSERPRPAEVAGAAAVVAAVVVAFAAKAR